MIEVKFHETDFVKPVSGNIYQIKYLLGRYTGHMKNGKILKTNICEPICITREEKQNNNDKQINKLIKIRKKLAVKLYKERVNKYLSGKNRIGLPGYKGRFYFLDAKYID